MSANSYRVAVVGGAGMWGRHYLRVFAEHPQCRIVGLVDRARERRQAFAERFGVERQYDEVEELLEDTVPDVVAAIVPVAQNLPVVRACAEAGVRVVSCEKPISAVLSEADEMVALCRRHGTLLGCGQAAWATPYMEPIIDWIHQGNIGALREISIPGGLPVEVSGAGCVQLAALRIVTRMETRWVEGWDLPPVPGYVAPDTLPVEADVPAYGTLGLSGGILCHIPRPGDDPHPAAFMTITGDNGQVWLARPRPVLIQGSGPLAAPVEPDFLRSPPPEYFAATVERLLRAFDTGEEPLSSGADFRHALETAIALRLSATQDHVRVTLPLPNRFHRLLPHPYRLYGGDRAGWESIGYGGPPRVPMELRSVTEFEDLTAVPFSDIVRLLNAADPKDLALAFQGMSPLMRKRAQMAAKQHGCPLGDEDLEAAEKTTPEEIEAARNRLVELARRL